MALVEMYVVDVAKTHNQYGAGDRVAFKPAEFEAYQDPKFKGLVKLVYIDLPNGDRIPADDDGKPQEDKKIPAATVKRDNRLRSKVHELIRIEKLTTEDEVRIGAAVIADADKAVKALEEDNATPGAFVAYVQELMSPRAAKPAMLDRGGRGPARTR
jgi:hypothetical protein